MRIALFHSDDPSDAPDALALAQLLSETGQEVLHIVRPGVATLFKDIHADLVRVIVDGDASTIKEQIKPFKPEAFAALADAPWPDNLSSAIGPAGSKPLLPSRDRKGDVRSRCEAIAREVVGDNGPDRLRPTRAQLAAIDAHAAELDAACADAVDQIARGIERSGQLRSAARLIATLQSALESQATDAADLQTQLEARAATITERDEQLRALRAQISELGLQLERMHRVGADLQEAHRVAGQLRERLEKLQSADSVALPKDELENLRERALQAQAHAARVNEVGAELQRMHVVAGELRSALAARNAELAASRVQVEELREQIRNLSALGTELHRVHGVAAELKSHIEIRNARISDLQRAVDEQRAQLETAKRDLRESDARAAASGASALVEAGRSARLSEAMAGTQQALIQAQARAETLRNDLSRARTDRDALDALVMARDGELAQLRTLLGSEQRARAQAAAERDTARARAAALRSQNASLRASEATLRQRVTDLLASRWRKIGQRFGVAMTLPWEKELREIKPGAIAPAQQGGPARAKDA